MHRNKRKLKRCSCLNYVKLNEKMCIIMNKSVKHNFEKLNRNYIFFLKKPFVVTDGLY